jgi:bifunctional N-acetylglucosamine-1-phosphate-uridyltransferase/glucosamine-1-phosphate-acetyltransferase GlmU-like protein
MLQEGDIMNKKSEIFAIIEQVENTQKQKGIAKYGDLDINSRRSKEQLLVDFLEELQDGINYGEAYSTDWIMKWKSTIRHIMLDAANELVKRRNKVGGNNE